MAVDPRPGRLPDDASRATAETRPPSAELRRLERIAHLLDDAFPIPFTRMRFGLDAVLGLVPGAGDVVSAVFGLTVVVGAARHGVPRVVLARMGINLAVDALIGLVPVAGDIGDVFFKANRRNLELLRRHAHAATPASRSDRLVVGAVLAIALLAIVGGVALLWAVVSWIARHPW